MRSVDKMHKYWLLKQVVYLINTRFKNFNSVSFLYLSYLLLLFVISADTSCPFLPLSFCILFCSEKARTGWSESYTNHSWYMFYLAKNKLQWNQKTKNQCHITCWKYRLLSAMDAFTVFILMPPCEEFLQRPEKVNQTKQCRIIWHRRTQKCIPKLILVN
jgi:hypothetical protein